MMPQQKLVPGRTIDRVLLREFLHGGWCTQSWHFLQGSPLELKK